MAKIIITIEDADEGTVVIFDRIPEFDRNDKNLTDAQLVALDIMDCLDDEESGFVGGQAYAQ